jgi:hypothetical protein
MYNVFGNKKTPANFGAVFASKNLPAQTGMMYIWKLFPEKIVTLIRYGRTTPNICLRN